MTRFVTILVVLVVVRGHLQAQNSKLETDSVRRELRTHRLDDRAIDELLSPGGTFDRIFKDPDLFNRDPGYGSGDHARKNLLDKLVNICGVAEELSKAATPAENEAGKALRDIVFVAPVDTRVIYRVAALAPKVSKRELNPAKSKPKVGPFGDVVWEDPNPSSTIRGLALILLVVDYSKNVEGGRTKLDNLCRKVLPDGKHQAATVESLASRIRSAEKAVFVPYHRHLKEGDFKSEKWVVEAKSFDSILTGVATELRGVATELSARPNDGKLSYRRKNLNAVVEEVSATRTAAILAEKAAVRSLTAEQTVSLTAFALSHGSLRSAEADHWAGMSLVMSLNDRKLVEQKVVDRLRAQEKNGEGRKLSLPTKGQDQEESAIYRRLMPEM